VGGAAPLRHPTSDANRTDPCTKVPLAPGSDLLVPAVLLDLYPKSFGGDSEVLLQ